jgi:Lon protease-like protein
MVEDVRASSGQFGICLISRGRDVGGGDQRVDIGTVVDLRAVFPFSDGRSMLVVDGCERLRITSWLSDDPYPRARVEVLSPRGEVVDGELLATATSAVKRLRRLHTEMYADSCLEHDCDLDDDPVTKTWQLCSMSPIATLDQLKLLSIDCTNERLVTLKEICCERYGDMTRQLASAQPAD